MEGGGVVAKKVVKARRKPKPVDAAALPPQHDAAAERGGSGGESTGARMDGLHVEQSDVCFPFMVASSAYTTHHIPNMLLLALFRCEELRWGPH
jgi:hypothetical protein